jgi:probable rRNA maturation factor
MWGDQQRAVILERRKSEELSRLALARFVNRTQRAAGVHGEVDILLTGDAELRRLNRQFRGQDKATDVLSFPSQAGGDIALSLQRARAQACEHGHDLLTEVKVLILHGMLHLAGYDHEHDDGQMRRQEEKLRAQLHLPSALIERSQGGSSQRPRRWRRTAAPGGRTRSSDG